MDDFDSFLLDDSDLESSSSSRSCCPSCERPSSVCWCPYLPDPRLEIRSKVIILQHPKEEKRGIRTALMAVRAVKGDRCKIIKGKKFPGDNQELQEVFLDPNTFVLYPGETAKDLSSLDPSDGPFNFVVLDGTWEEAKRLYDRNPSLQSLKQVILTTEAKSAYVVRTQPADFCLSTLETVAQTLAAAEGRAAIAEEMARPLHAMCNFQINHGAVEHDSKEFKEQNGRFVKKNNFKKSKQLKKLEEK